MLSVSPSMIARSSLEEMLNSLRRREEEEIPKDLSPIIPSRPRSIGRPPSAKRPFPNKLENVVDGSTNFSCIKKKEVKRSRGDSFSGKKSNEGNDSENRGAKMASVSRPSSASRFAECSINSNFGYFIKQKLQVWCQLQNGQWEWGQIQSTSEETANVLLVNGSVVNVATEYLLPANPVVLEGVDGLIQLSYLNEPSVLHNLEYRYSRDMIYSMSGPVLIAINPFKTIDLYGTDYATAYRQKLLNSPHVYAIADAAYSKMMRDGVSQSIIISGESGSGKSETEKIAMQYLGALGGSNGGMDLELIHTSHKLEAFGNAKTSCNDNSSRFGKSIEIYFSAAGNVCAAKIQTFLEKIRVVLLARQERSFHIFYQLCAGAPSTLREKLNIKAASEYNYLNQSGCLAIDNIDDAQKFQILMGALNMIGMSEDNQEHVFEVVAAVLWLGNISFQVTDNENHVKIVNDEASTTVASLIGCHCQDFMLALSTNRLQSEIGNTDQKLTLQQAIDKRDALAKFLYASLFNWLVDNINRSLEKGKRQTGRFICILDIFGFESFQKNSLEQLFINYANERLQQHFIRHLLKLQQEEYALDGIDWTNVEFRDNKECLDLFEKKHIGIISLLDKESSYPKASGLTFADKLNQHLNTHRRFKVEQSGAFTICHYPGEVLYNTNIFLEKNRDPLHSDTVQFLSACKGQLPQLFASYILDHRLNPASRSAQFGASKFHNQSVGTKFKIVRIARCGYPSRMTHQNFAERYGFLSKYGVCQDPLTASVSVLNGALEEARKQVLRGTLEVQKCFRCHQARRYFHELRRGVISLQSLVRAANARRKYDSHINLREQVVQKKHNEQQMAVLQLQTAIRGWLARKQFKILQNLKKLNQENSSSSHGSRRRISEMKEMPQETKQLVLTVMEELQRRVLKAETTLERKEQKHATLRDQVEQYETRWLEHEGKMKLMEDMWQKQITSLQMSLSAVKRSLADNTSVEPARQEGSPLHQFFDSGDRNFVGTQAPGVTPIKLTNSISELGAGQQPHDDANAVSQLVKEFEQRKQTFDNEVKSIVEVKSGHLASANPVEELRNLKNKFETWMKDYKARLREAKAKLRKPSLSDAEKRGCKWWGGISKR